MSSPLPLLLAPEDTEHPLSERFDEPVAVLADSDSDASVARLLAKPLSSASGTTNPGWTAPAWKVNCVFCASAVKKSGDDNFWSIRACVSMPSRSFAGHADFAKKDN